MSGFVISKEIETILHEDEIIECFVADLNEVEQVDLVFDLFDECPFKRRLEILNKIMTNCNTFNFDKDELEKILNFVDRFSKYLKEQIEIAEEEEK